MYLPRVWRHAGDPEMVYVTYYSVAELMEVLQHDKDIQGPAEDLDSIVVMTQPALKYHLLELRFVKSIPCLEANSSSNSYCQTNLNHMSSTKLSHIPTA